MLFEDLLLGINKSLKYMLFYFKNQDGNYYFHRVNDTYSFFESIHFIDILL